MTTPTTPRTFAEIVPFDVNSRMDLMPADREGWNLPKERASRRGFLKWGSASLMALGLASIGLFRHSKPAVGHGHAPGFFIDIAPGCNGLVYDNICIGCEGSPPCDGCCFDWWIESTYLGRWHKYYPQWSDMSNRPNKCKPESVQETIYDGWYWAAPPGQCSCSTGKMAKCHDGKIFLWGGWLPTVCRVSACGYLPL